MNGTDIEHLHLADCLLLAPRWLRISPRLVARQLWPDHWSETPHPISCCNAPEPREERGHHFSGDSGLAVEQIRVASTVWRCSSTRESLAISAFVTASSVGGADRNARQRHGDDSDAPQEGDAVGRGGKLLALNATRLVDAVPATNRAAARRWRPRRATRSAARTCSTRAPGL